MAKRQDESPKDKNVRSKKARSASQVIMEMTNKDAEKLRTIFWNARSRRAPSRGQSPLDRSGKTDK